MNGRVKRLKSFTKEKRISKEDLEYVNNKRLDWFKPTFSI